MCRRLIAIASILGVSSVASAFLPSTHQQVVQYCYDDVAAVPNQRQHPRMTTRPTALFSSSYLQSLQASTADPNDIPSAAATTTATTTTPPLSNTQPKKKKKNNKSGPHIIETLDSVSDFFNYLDHAPKDSLSVVEFYGKNCPLCKRVALKYKKIANTYSKRIDDPVRFAQMEHPANKPVMDVLGIRTFPFLHVYRNGQCVAAHGTESDATFEGIVKDTIQRELDMTKEDWNAFLTAFAGPIQQGTDRLDQLRGLLLLEEEGEE